MRELIYTGAGVQWQESPALHLENDKQALVEPITATICDIDRLILAGKAPVRPPFPLGHECIARVVDVGDAVDTVQPGDTVVVPWSISCGDCQACRSGLSAHCNTVPSTAMFGAPMGGYWGGVFADEIRIPYADAMLVPLPETLDPISMASASDNWPLAWRLVAPHLAQRPNARVIILSHGAVGLYACDIALQLGASEVLYVDPDEANQAIARSYGATTATQTDPIPHGFDIAVEATASPTALSVALQSLKPEGICESAGGFFRNAEVPLASMFLTGVTLRIARDNIHAHLADALALASAGGVSPRPVISSVHPWEELPTQIMVPGRKPVFVRDQSAV